MTRELTFKIGLILALLFTATTARAAEDILSIVPSDSLACVVVHRLAETDGKIQNLVKQVNPAAAISVLNLAKGTMGIAKGLDEKGDAAIIVMPGVDSRAIPTVVAAVPVSDYDAFIEPMNPKKPGEKIAELELNGQSLVAAKLADYALLTEQKSRAALEKVLDSKKNITGDLTGLESWRAPNDMTIVATSAGIKQFALKAGQMLNVTKMQLGDSPEAKRVFDVYSSIIDLVGKEASLIVVGLQADKEGTLQLRSRTRFSKDGKFDRMLAGVQSPQENLLAGLPGGPFFFAFGGDLPEGAMKALVGMSAEMMKSSAKIYGITPEQAEKMAKMTVELMETEPFQGMSMMMQTAGRNDPIYSGMLGSFRIGNAPRFLEAYEKQLAAIKDILKDSKESRFPITEAKRTEIEGKPALEVTPDISKQFGKVPNAELLSKMFGPDGKTTTYLVAVDERHIVFGYGALKAKLKDVIAAIHEPKSGLAVDPEVAKMVALLPAGAQGIGLLSPRGTVAFFGRTVAAANPTSGFVLPAFPNTPPIGMAIKAVPGEIEKDLVIPAAVFKAVGEYVAKLRQGAEHPAIP